MTLARGRLFPGQVGYIVLPFVLPLMGVATGAALGILLTLDVIAAIAILAMLRRLWRLQHPRRWQYLPVALALAVLVGVFLANDMGVLYVQPNADSQVLVGLRLVRVTVS